MDDNTKHIVASNLTVAYFAGMPHQLSDPNVKPAGDPRLRGSQMQQPFNEVIGVYKAFLSLLGGGHS